MRGKALICIIPRFANRITPAYAGKRPQDETGLPPKEDHPRICGEKSAFPAAEPPVLGSPPHMRGKDLWAIQFKALYGITPAYAGKRLCLIVVH